MNKTLQLLYENPEMTRLIRNTCEYLYRYDWLKDSQIFITYFQRANFAKMPCARTRAKLQTDTTIVHFPGALRKDRTGRGKFVQEKHMPKESK